MKRTIDLASIIGLILAIGLVFMGIVTSTDAETREISINFSNLSSFFDITSLLIVLGGTLGCMLIMFPLAQFAKIPKHMMIIFMPKQYKPEDYINILVDMGKKSRTSGLLALEEDIKDIQDPFLVNAIQKVVDSVDPEKVKIQMEAWLEGVDERHTQEKSFYDKGTALAPAFGMVGTLIGLINMLRNLSDIETVGPNMAVALITTLYGSLLANIFFMPISNKLAVRHEEEYLCLQIISEGVQAIQAGENPNLIQDRLLQLLPEYKKKSMKGDEGEEAGGKGKGNKKSKK